MKTTENSSTLAERVVHVWTDGTTGGFNIEADSQTLYCDSYETAFAELVRRGATPQDAVTALNNAAARVRYRDRR